ncbi:NF-X1-type zinc finger protein NFXL1 [Tanacetum coccineum]
MQISITLMNIDKLLTYVQVVDMSSYQARDRRPRYLNSNHRQIGFREADQPSYPYLTPHSCGEPCGKALEKDLAANASYDDDEGDHCSHRCVVQCHPGPCPPYKAFAPPKMCPCGKKTITIRCSDHSQKSLLTYGQRCGKLLNCQRIMYEVVVCGDVAVKGHVNVVKDGLFSCNSECGKTLGLKHVCKETSPWCLWDVNCSKAVHHPQIGSRHRGDLVELTSGDTITLGTTSKLSVSLFAKMRFGYNADTALEAFVVQKLPAPLQPDEANGKRTLLGQRKLVCDNECSKLKSKKVLADAFRVNTSVSLAYHMLVLLTMLWLCKQT